MIGIKDILELTAPIHGGPNRVADHVRRSVSVNNPHSSEPTASRPTTWKPRTKLIALPAISDEVSRHVSAHSRDRAA